MIQRVFQLINTANTMDSKLQELEIDGKKVSSVLPANVKNFLIDIDGTICEDIPNEEPERMADAALYPGAVEKVNQWYDEGHIITFFTSRTEEHREVTSYWLNKHGFKYHGMLMGKPRGGNYHWIDNHDIIATKYTGRFSDFIEKMSPTQVFE